MESPTNFCTLFSSDATHSMDSTKTKKKDLNEENTITYIDNTPATCILWKKNKHGIYIVHKCGFFFEIIISNHSIDIQCVEDLDRDIIIIIIALIIKFFFFCV